MRLSVTVLLDGLMNIWQGGSTAHISNPSFWNYKVAYLVYKTRVDIQKHSAWVDAANFHTTAEREPANPTT
jgi:hypothetical protein